MSKIELSDNTMTIIMKMAEGNPGAITALSEMVKQGEAIDPQSAIPPLGAILLLDTYEIYGSAIYVLWSDKCGRDVRKLLILIRSVQLGFLPESKLQAMAADQCREVDLTPEEYADLDKKVCESLEQFQKAA